MVAYVPIFDVMLTMLTGWCNNKNISNARLY